MSGIEAREIMEAGVRRELFGPPPGESSRGKPLEIIDSSVHFESWPATYGLWHDAVTGEEILSDTEPLRRYGIGVLYPQGSEARGLPAENIVGTTGLPADDEIRDVGPTGEIAPSRQPDSDTDDFDLSDANSFQPSAMAVSFRVRVAAGQSLQVMASCAYYDKIAVQIVGSKRVWWLRRPLTMIATVGAASLLAQGKRLFPVDAETSHLERVRPQLQVYSRPVPGDTETDTRLVTIVLVNTTKGSGSAAALFQAAFEVRPLDGARIESYREGDAPDDLGDEEASIAMLYRNKRSYAIGHGCAADWDEPDSDAVAVLRADSLPTLRSSCIGSRHLPQIIFRNGWLRHPA